MTVIVDSGMNQFNSNYKRNKGSFSGIIYLHAWSLDHLSWYKQSVTSWFSNDTLQVIWFYGRCTIMWSYCCEVQMNIGDSLSFCLCVLDKIIWTRRWHQYLCVSTVTQWFDGFWENFFSLFKMPVHSHKPFFFLSKIPITRGIRGTCPTQLNQCCLRDKQWQGKKSSVSHGHVEICVCVHVAVGVSVAKHVHASANTHVCVCVKSEALLIVKCYCLINNVITMCLCCWLPLLDIEKI